MEVVAKRKRAAAYCRVSTGMECQEGSYETQIRYYENMISNDPDAELVKIYADEASGRSTQGRSGFRQMMNDCENGRIDVIYTKSISRFSRNMLDCVTAVRRLKELGIAVIFEKEGIDTATAVSEMILTVMAAFAQEESRSISENLKWGIRKRFSEGKHRWTPTYGYRHNADGEIDVVSDEAAIVRLIFEMYRHGMSLPDILGELARREIPSIRGNRKWTAAALQYLLRNEKYIGDIRLQKWVSIDHISHKSVQNDSTVVPSFYIKNHHMPIIDRHTYRQVQRIMELKNPRGEYSRYPYCDTKFICPLCGKNMVTRVLKSHGHNRIIGCFGDNGCQGYAVKVCLADTALLEAYNALEVKDNPKASMGRMLEIKEESPQMYSVQYYWLDDLVEHIEFAGDTMKVFWQCGLCSEVALHAVNAAEPTHVAEIYRNYAARKQQKNGRSVMKNDDDEAVSSMSEQQIDMRSARKLSAAKQKGSVEM